MIGTVLSLLERDESLVLATVVEQTGSAPRSEGAFMIVRKGGAIVGTIGGGIVEARVKESAVGMFPSESPRLLSFDLRGEDGAGLDLICGGRMEILLEFIAPTPSEKRPFLTLREAMASKRSSFLIRRLNPESIDRAIFVGGKLVWHTDGFPAGSGRRLVGECRNIRGPNVVLLDGERYFFQPFRAPSRLCLFGAGHVAREVAHLARHVGFDVVVLDDRAEFANRDRFSEAAEVIVLDSFEECVASLAPDGETFLVILTRGHRHDRRVLEQALRSGAGYIGMIGSRAKWREMSRELLASGFSEADLRRVHTPIGIPIASETPEEIAVSIVGELILSRAGALSKAVG